MVARGERRVEQSRETGFNASHHVIFAVPAELTERFETTEENAGGAVAPGKEVWRRVIMGMGAPLFRMLFEELLFEVVTLAGCFDPALMCRSLRAAASC